MDDSELTTTERSMVGTIIDGRFELVAELGTGGMGTVFKAKHVTLSKFYALKILSAELNNNLDFRARFDREAKTASLLDHPNLVAIHDYGTTPSGEAYLLMDYVDGPSLDDELKQYGRLPPERAVPVFIQVCQGLGHAHKKGVIHRDLKPSNIMLAQKHTGVQDGDGSARVVDFGIAKTIESVGQGAQGLTKTGQILGSPLYMSPEQAGGTAITAQTDIYSLGVVMYHCLTGQPPFRGENAFATMTMHMEASPKPFNPDLSIDKKLEAIVMKALEKEPGNRFSSAEELHEALSSISALSGSQSQSLPARRPKPATANRLQGADKSAPAARGKASSPVKIALAAGALACLIGAGAILLVSRGHSNSDTAKEKPANPISSLKSPVKISPASTGGNAAAQAWPDGMDMPQIPAGYDVLESDKNLPADKLAEKGLKMPKDSFLGARYQIAALQRDPQLDVAYDNLGGFYWTLQEKMEKEKNTAGRNDALENCLKVYTTETRMLPKYAGGFHYKATIEECLGRHALALADEDMAIKLDPKDNCHHLSHAWYLKQLGKREDALREMSSNIHKENIQDMTVCANLYRELNRNKEAVEATTRWMKLAGKRLPGLLYERAQAERDMGLYKEAINDFTELSKISPETDPQYQNDIKFCQEKWQKGSADD